MSTILKVDDINVYYGSIHAIKGISFEVNEGEIVTLIGANGAGKSTTLNTISGLLHSKTGHIEFMGEPLNHVPSHKVVSKGLALVPEGRRIFLQMSVQENLDMGAFSRRVAVRHDEAGMEAELNTMVDNGCTVVDVIVEHPLYGQLTGPLQLSSRYDVAQFIARSHTAQPLSVLTGGIHLHTLLCPSEDAYRRVLDALRQAGFLLEG